MSVSRSDPGRVPDRLSLFTLITSQSAYTSRVRDHSYAGSGTTEDPYQVEWLQNDPRNPLLMPRPYKWIITLIQTAAVFSVTFASSALSAADPQIQQEFNASPNLTIANTSLFILAFAIGPVIAAPLSELYGRQLIFLLSFSACTLFSGATIVAKDIGTLLGLRLLAGAFGANGISNSGAVVSDLFITRERGIGMLVLIGPAFLGPSIAPIACSYLAVAAGWRRVQTLVTVFLAIGTLLGVLFIPETYAPVLQQKRAKALSKATGKVYKTRLDIDSGPKTPRALFQRAMTMPWRLLFREPIGFLIAIYMAIIYGTLYMEFAAFPLVFEGARGWSQATSGLAFAGMGIGQISGIVYITVDDKRYQRIVDRTPNGQPPPESRLNPSLVGAVTLPIGLFLFAWTNFASIHWIVCEIGTVLLGFSHVVIFLSGTNYLVDTYTLYAASAMAANTVVRALFGAAFPLFADPMYNRLGIHWGSSIPAFLALICTPVPWLFYIYGSRIRRHCKYAAESARLLDQMLKSAVQHVPHNANSDSEKDSTTDKKQITRAAVFLDGQATESSVQQISADLLKILPITAAEPV